MNILASLFRVIFSIIVLLAIACYLQATPSVSLCDFCLFIEPAKLVQMLSGFNAVTVTLGIILLLGILSFTRVLEAAWNILFCASVIIVLAAGLYTFGGPSIALPSALYHNDTILQFCQVLSTYHVPLAIAGLIFVAGWICASACGRVAITALLSFGLWYGLTELFTYIVDQWAKSADPKLPEALHMVQSSPWIIAAVPAAFFLIYALLMAFFETFITKAPKAAKVEQKDDKKNDAKVDTASKPTEAKPVTEETKQPATKIAEPVAKSKPVLKTTTPAPQKQLKLATAATAPAAAKEAPAEAPAAPKAEEEKPEVKEKPEETEKPAPKAVEEEPKTTGTPASPEEKKEPSSAVTEDKAGPEVKDTPATEETSKEEAVTKE